MREKLATLPLTQLKELAKSQGIRNISGLRKAELIDRLCEAAESAGGAKVPAENNENRENTAAPMQAALPPAQQAEEVPPYEDEGCEAPPPPEDYEEPDTGWQEPYYEEPPAPHQQPQPGIYCADCRKEITAVNTRNGAVWTPDDIAGYSQRVFGRILCNECQRKARGGRK